MLDVSWQPTQRKRHHHDDDHAQYLAPGQFILMSLMGGRLPWDLAWINMSTNKNMNPCDENKRNQIQYQEHGHEIGSGDRNLDTSVGGKEIPNRSALPMKAISTLYNVKDQEIQQEKQERQDPYHSGDQFCVSNETHISKWMKNGEITIHCHEDKCYDADSEWQVP